MNKNPLNLLITLFCVTAVFSQNSVSDVYKNITSPSFLKQNTFFINPTFTLVKNGGRAITLFNRNSFTGFDNSPQFNLASFTGKVHDNLATGLAIYKQSKGVFINFGALANYAYQVKTGNNSNLSFGFNFILNRNSLDNSKIVLGSPDPTVNSFIENTSVILQPAINYNLGNFNLGFFIKDLVDYNFTDKKILTPFSNKTISGHVMYTHKLKSAINFLQNSSVEAMVIANTSLNSRFTGSLILDIPQKGWLQTSYDDFHGYAAGLGIKLSQKMAISYVYENGKNSLGATNEIGITYFLNQTKKSFQLELKNSTPKIVKKEIQEIETKEVIAPKKEVIKTTIAPKLIEEKIYTEDVPKISTLRKSKNLKSGYYLIVNVFSVEENAVNFMRKLQAQDLEPQYFINPINNYWYVYILRSDNKEEIFVKFKNNFNGKYVHEKWIMRVL